MTNILNKELFQKLEIESKLSPTELLELPEKVIQFGTGVLLRGLPDYYIDKANKEGLFSGRIVVVKSTAQGGPDEFVAQDNLYTIGVIGYDGDNFIETYHINAAISQVINANTDWAAVQEKATVATINIVISNTTEKGIELVEENIFAMPPSSFPAKLLAYLYKRYEALGNDEASAITILPTELINHNGEVLKGIVDQLIKFNSLDQSFIEWYKSKVSFHNTLVDRIVPGLPKSEFIHNYYDKIGYEDKCLLIAEPYNLWAIEGGDDLKEKLSFASIHSGIKITADIDKFKELKLRLLNATHSFTAAYAIYRGFNTVRDAMHDESFDNFIMNITEEIIAVLPSSIPLQERIEFRNSVISRFKNPELKHYWASIILNYTDKFKVRCMPLIDQYIAQKKSLPQHMMIGLKYFMQLSIPDKVNEGKYSKDVNGISITLNDPLSATIFDKYNSLSGEAFNSYFLSDLLGVEITAIKMFTATLTAKN